MWEKLSALDITLYALECCLANIETIHQVMENDGGVNWQKRCNALFSACNQMGAVLEELRKLSNEALDILIVERGQK